MKLCFDNTALDELVKNVFKEVGKQSSSIDLNYKLCSLRCLADLVQFSSTQSNETYFEKFWSSILELYFSNELENLILKENKRHENLIEQIRNKNNVTDVEMKETKNDSSEIQENNEAATKKKSKKETEVENREEEEEEQKKGEAIKLVILESIGKCWSYNSDIQG